MGGNFDPVHTAHLRLAEDAMRTLNLEAVRWIPSGLPGHRVAPQATAAQRLKMLELAIAGKPGFYIDPAELGLATPTFSIQTLRRLRAELGPDRPLVMLIGMDSFLGLDTWREWEALFDLTHFGIGQRPGYELKIEGLAPSLKKVYRARLGVTADLHAAPHGKLVHFDSTPLAISSSDIRARLAGGQNVAGMLPDPVWGFIQTQGLYQ